jgi:hypothetical protein
VINESTQARGYHKRNSLSYVVLGLFIDRATYLEPGAQGWRAFRPYYVNGPAYGGLFGTADGFARYVQALLDPSDDLLSEESRRLLFTENLLAGGEPSGMSLSWFKGDLAGHPYYAHAGGGGGYYAEIRLYPEVQRGSVILFNRSGLSDERFLDRVDLPLLAAAVPASPRAATQVRSPAGFQHRPPAPLAEPRRQRAGRSARREPRPAGGAARGGQSAPPRSRRCRSGGASGRGSPCSRSRTRPGRQRRTR